MRLAGGERCFYAVQAVVFGLPAMAVAVPGVLTLSVLGVFLLSQLDRQGLPALLLAAAAGAGVVSWWVLSGTYLLDGRAALKALPNGWWIGLSAGVVVAALMAAPLIYLAWDQGLHLRDSLAVLPALVLVPSLHLLWLKFRK